MARGGVHLAPYEVVLAILHWARTNWTWVDGHHLSRGVDIEVLSAKRFMNLLDNFYIQDSMVEEHVGKARDLSRAKLTQAYNEGVESLSGVANDGPFELPYGETPQTDDGFMGLEPPIG